MRRVDSNTKRVFIFNHKLSTKILRSSSGAETITVYIIIQLKYNEIQTKRGTEYMNKVNAITFNIVTQGHSYT